MTGGEGEGARDLGSLVVPAAGALVETGDLWEPYYLKGPGGGRVEPVSEFLRVLQAMGRPATTQRSYALALLRWFRFLWAVEIGWDRATRVEARDFCCWMRVAATGRGRGCIARRCWGVSTTFTGTRFLGRWSTRSRWCASAGRVVCAPITIRWSRTGMSAAGCIGPRSLPGCPAG